MESDVLVSSTPVDWRLSVVTPLVLLLSDITKSVLEGRCTCISSSSINAVMIHVALRMPYVMKAPRCITLGVFHE